MENNSKVYEKLHFLNWASVLFIIANLSIIIWLINMVRTDGTDKAPIIIWVLYPILLLVDCIVWLIVRWFNQKLGKLFSKYLVALIILFFPILIFSYI